VFEARGRAANGLWGEAEPLALEIVPPFWMTWWFRSILLLLLLLAALSVHFTRQAVLQRRAEKLLQLGEQRERALEEQLGDAAEIAVLTPRQKEILQLIAEGYATREIAELLRVSIKTVEAHRANLMERLDIHDVPGLVRLAIRTRLVSVDG
jgi:DNA-binding NarL/FixJ family response regulator